MVMYAGKNEAAIESAASSSGSSRTASSIHSARRLCSQCAITQVQLRFLASAGLRRPHHHRVNDVCETATSQRQDQGPDTALCPAVSFV